MNSFEKVILALGLNTDSQGDAGWLYALLKYATANQSGGDTFTNSAREAIRRLEVANIGPHTLARVKQMLNTLAEQIDSGKR